MTARQFRDHVRRLLGLPPRPSGDSRADREQRRRARLDADARAWRKFEAAEREAAVTARVTDSELLRDRLERRGVVWPWEA
jgi:hypothetical protein